jgi:hypothetical protein
MYVIIYCYTVISFARNNKVLKIFSLTKARGNEFKCIPRTRRLVIPTAVDRQCRHNLSNNEYLLFMFTVQVPSLQGLLFI